MGKYNFDVEVPEPDPKNSCLYLSKMQATYLFYRACYVGSFSKAKMIIDENFKECAVPISELGEMIKEYYSE